MTALSNWLQACRVGRLAAPPLTRPALARRWQRIGSAQWIGPRSQRSGGSDPQVELVNLPDQVGTVALMRLLGNELESARQIDVAGRGKRVIRPEAHLLVSRGAGKGDALVYELAAEAVAAGGRVYEQDPELCGDLVGGDAEDAADAAAIDFGNPGGFPFWVVAGRVIGDDFCDQRFEARVPSVFGGVDLAVGHHYPAEIA